MKLNKVVFAIVSGLLLLTGCKEDLDKGFTIVEYPGGSSYFIKNQSNYDLVAEFPVLIFDVNKNDWISKDSTVVIPKMSISRFYEDLGHIGSNPSPKSSFTEIMFHRFQNGEKNLALKLHPVEDNKWSAKIISRNGGYGLTEYYFEIQDNDLQ